MKCTKLKASLIAGMLFWHPTLSGKVLSSSHSPVNTIVKEAIFPLQHQHCHGSTLVELPNGDMLCAWFQGSGERTSDDVAIWGSRYHTKTRLWSKPFIMADVPGFPDINPVLFIDGKQRLWLTWYTVMAYQWSTSLLKYRISDNYMQKSGPPVWSWQDVLHIKADGSPNTGIGSNDTFVRTLEKKYDEYFQYLREKGDIRDTGKSNFPAKSAERARKFYIDLAKGSSLVSEGSEKSPGGEIIRKHLGYPLMRRIGWQTRNKPLITGNRIILPLYSDGLNLSLMAITDDWGINWTFSEPILGGGAIQPSLAAMKDGTIMALMRDNGPPPKRLMKSVSADAGVTWNTVTDTDIPNPGTAADVIVLRNGNWALVHNDLEDGRYRLSVWLSRDEGKTWPYRKILVNGKTDGVVRGHYPAIIQGKNGLIHVSYTNQEAYPGDGSEVKNIVHAVFPENWLIQ